MIISQDFIWWMGVVEDISDPELLGRVKVRIFGFHSADKILMPISSLPWAIVMQPTTSAGTSGIGSAPVGLMQGSWVVGFFADGIDKQQPIVMGSLGGKVSNVTSTYTTIASDVTISDTGTTIVDENGNDITQRTDTNAPSNLSDLPPLNKTQKRILKELLGDELSGSEYSKQSDEALGKYQIKASDLAEIGLLKKRADGSVQPNDINDPDNWIGDESEIAEFIGVSSADNFLENPIAQEKAIDLILEKNYNRLKALNYIIINDFSPENIQKAVGLLAVSVGDIKVAMEMAATGILPGNKLGIDFTSRYNNATQAVGADEPPSPSVNLATTPAGYDPTAANLEVDQRPFTDPSGEFPRKEYDGFPDTNKLATGQGSVATSTVNRNAKRVTNIPTASGSTWNEPSPAYCATYPYNQTFETRAGHVVEFDNTPNSERIHIYHKTGTYIEIDVNGTMVRKVVGENNEIIENDNKLYVKGGYTLTVEGPTQILVKDETNIVCHGTVNATMYNDVNMNVSGDMNTTVKGDYRIRAKNFRVTAENAIDMYGQYHNTTVSEDVNIRSKQYKLTTAGTPYGVFINSAQKEATSISSNGLGIAPDRKTVIPSTPKTFRRPDCILSDILFADEEADNEEFTKQIKQQKKETLSEQGIETTITNSAPTGDPISPGAGTTSPMIIRNCGFGSPDSYNPSNKISKYFTLGDLSSHAKVVRDPVIDQRGLSKAQIACNLKTLAVNCLDKIKQNYPNMIVTNGFRKDGAGRSPTSYHGEGKAADLQFVGISSNKQLVQICKWISENVPYTQILFEHAREASNPWIHIALGITADGQIESAGSTRIKTGTLWNHKPIDRKNFVPFKDN